MRIDFSTLPAWINDSFLPLWTDSSRFIICKGGAGSGKSVDAHRRAVYRLIAEPGHNFAVVRKVGRTLGISCIPLIRQCISEWGMWRLITENKSNQIMTCNINGNQIKFLGIDDIEKIKSITFENGPLTDVLIEEATEITEKDFNQLNLRLRGSAKVPFQITMLLNPISDTHWIKRRFFDNPGAQKEKITTHSSTYHDNRFLDEGYKDELEGLKYQDRVYYDVYTLGKWGSRGNLVFRNVVYGECKYKPEDFDRIIAGQDFGFNHYNAIELIGFKDGDKYSFAELYVRHMTNDEVITENERLGILDKRQCCIADSAEPKSIREWQQAGYNVTGAKKGADSVKEQISLLNRGTWHVDPVACPGLVSEISTYKWKEDRDGNPLDEPVKFKDDGISACRYAVEDEGDSGPSVGSARIVY
jgi:phage terminase large subunit